VRLTAPMTVVGLLVGTLTALAAPEAAAASLDPRGPEGLDLHRAWTITQGAPSSVIGYVEGGVNWHLPNSRRIAEHSFVNVRELPLPRPGGTQAARYDADGDGAVTAVDWTGDPRARDANGNGFLDPEDLIVAFRDGRDDDRNGFPDDISGWDFYDDQPDPATTDSTYGHANGQMATALDQCPKCLVLPIKAGAEALDATDRLAEAWLYAADMKVSVITSVTADLGYSSFMRQVVDTLAERGIAMVESSNDFDSTDHQGGMFWPGVVPGNGALADPSGTRWVRANVTSWGTHNMFTIPGEGSTSAATGATGGLVGLLMAWGQQEYAAGHIPAPVSGQQAVQILRATATPVTDTTLPWPGAPGDWSLQYGYGIPNLFRAMLTVSFLQAPPDAAITSPDWYTTFDPARPGGARPFGVDARVTVAPGRAWTWELQVGVGPQPTSFTAVADGTRTGPWRGRLGTVSPDAVPREVWEKAMATSAAKELPTAEQYALTLRLVVRLTDVGVGGGVQAPGVTGVDRRAVYVHHDPSLVAGFPAALPGVRGYRAAGESQPALVDLDGSGRLAIVFGTADGVVHALDPMWGSVGGKGSRTRRELPGWPVTTDRLRPRGLRAGMGRRIDPGHEPVLANVAVGDLRGDGRPVVVVTSLSGKVYAWDARGHRLRGWPRTLDTGVTPPAIPRPALRYTRLPVKGAVSAPVLADLTGTGRLAVVQSGWDGHVHAFVDGARELPGFPVRVELPAGTPPPPAGYVRVNDRKVDATPAVAYLDGPGKPPSLVVRSQYTDTGGEGIQFAGYGYVFAYRADGSLRSGWPARLPSVLEYYGSAQEFITEGSSSAVAADVTGTGVDRVAVSTVFSVPLLLDGDGRVVGAYGIPVSDVPRLTDPSFLLELLGRPQDLPLAFTTSGAFGKVGGSLRFVQAGSGAASLASALLNNNSGRGIDHWETAWPAAGGAPSPGFPARRQGLDFLGSPIVADLDGDGSGDVVDGGDSNAMHAYGDSGAPAAGFPKFTAGWTVFAPAAGDLFGDGRTHLVATSREGYLYVWSTPGTAAGNTEWWRWQHDEHNSGRYGTVTRAPGAVRGLAWRPGRTTATFTAPGDTWYSGAGPASYRVTAWPSGRSTTVRATSQAGARQAVPVPRGTWRLTVQAVNAAGLKGLPVTR
jgi:hypothetical protein